MTEHPCPICGGLSFNTVWRWGDLRHGGCDNCGHVYSQGANSRDADYQGFQQSYSDDYLLDPSNEIFALARQRAKRIDRAPGRALEIGCSYGHFLHLLKSQGWQVEGIEPSSHPGEFARSYFGIEVSNGMYDASESHSGTGYDLIAAFHVLEHLNDPRDFLRRIHADLRPEGLLALAVPNIDTLPRDFTELWFVARGWHLHTFDPVHLRWLLTSVGYAVLDACDEPMTRMSPSSFFILAEKGCGSIVDRWESTKGHEKISEFHKTLDTLAERFRMQVEEWVAQGHRVAVYGGGIHTEALLTLCGVGRQQIACIIDDDINKRGRRISGIETVGADDGRVVRCSVVVVSTLAAEERLTQRLRVQWPHKEVYGFYWDLGVRKWATIATT